jgi:energy-coupling factor transporter transmembrane protein EcfT
MPVVSARTPAPSAFVQPSSETPLWGLDPRTRLLLLAAAAVAVVALDRPAPLIALASVSAIAFASAPRKSVGAAAALGAIAWSTVLGQGLFFAGFPRTAIVELGPITLWREGFAWGALQAMRTASLGLLGLWVVGSTSPEQLVVGLSGLGVPGPIALLTASALRFAPELARRADLARSAYVGRTGRSPGPIAAIGLLVPVLARSLRRAQALAELLDARGFDPAAARTQRVPGRLGAADLGLLGIGLSGAAMAITARVLYAAYVGDVWWHPALKPLYGLVRGWL